MCGLRHPLSNTHGARTPFQKLSQIIFANLACSKPALSAKVLFTHALSSRNALSAVLVRANSGKAHKRFSIRETAEASIRQQLYCSLAPHCPTWFCSRSSERETRRQRWCLTTASVQPAVLCRQAQELNLKEKFAMRNNEMGDIEQRVRFGLGSAAAAVAIFAPLDYKWKGILTGIAASSILTGIYRISPAKRFVGM